uniref:Uncharacterized protein n=1 Tax=Anguilla anguilla TaxID=7936 RepID=A0A0E9PJM8_ANGAN
MKKFSSTFLK